LPKNKVLRRKFGQKKKEETGSWTKMQNEELHNLHSIGEKK
jgi:hypothetical protein